MSPVPLLDLHRQFAVIKPEIEEAVRKCFNHQNWILGPEVGELEKQVADYLGGNHCIGTSSGTDALVLALRALTLVKKKREYLEESDKVITSPFTFTATGDAILRSGATPLFVDVDPLTFNLDPLQVKRCIEKYPDVFAILPVHLYGNPCSMDLLQEVAEAKGVPIIEDVAQAFGGEWRGRKLGTFGAVGCFSFFPSKNLGGYGDGGMCVTDDPEIASLIRALTKHGGRDKYNVDHVGYNARLDTLQAAFLLVKLKRLSEWNEKRKKISAYYSESLKNLEGMVLPIIPSLGSHVFNQYTIRVLGGRRDDLQAHLKKKEVGTMVYYPTPLHKMRVFSGQSLVFESLTNAEQLCSEVLSLPIEPLLTEEELEQVCSSVRSFFI